MSSEFSVVAIIAAHNEADIVGHVVADLIEQGVQVYFLDDGSTDDTVAVVEPYVGRGVIRIEHLSKTLSGDRRQFEWGRILNRKAQVATELDADWFIHHDADEFRESPWFDVPLREGIRRVDTAGFNAIDFALLDFLPVHNQFRPGDDVRKAFPAYAPGAVYDRLQIRCWKRTAAPVDLSSSGGHEAIFPGRCVFPIRFILRHYPIRGQSHGERKILHERRPRFLEEERNRGWHVQYDHFADGSSLVRDPGELTPFDSEKIRMQLSLRNRDMEELEARYEALRCQARTFEEAHDGRMRELEGIKQELQGRSIELEARTRERDERMRDLEAANESRDLLSHELADIREALHARDSRIDGLDHELHTHVRNVESLEAQLAVSRVEIENLRRTIADSLGRLDQVYRSRSWRWTRPARAVLRLLTER